MNATPKTKFIVPVLFISVCIIATCGLLYELLISTISAYLLGSSIFHFSLTIGLFLSFMGLGAYLSRFFSDKNLLDSFIIIEIWLGIIGGLSGALLYVAYAYTENYYIVAFLLTGAIGTLIGLEIPILTRIVYQYFNLKDTLAQVLSFDYLGALLASLLFPLLLLPYLGTLRTSFVIGLLNLGVAVFNLFAFKDQLQNFRMHLGLAFAAISLYFFGLFYSFGLSAYLEQLLYQDEVVFSKQSPYQRVVLTKWKNDVRLFIDENLQFCSIDEYRYHETLVHIPLLLHPKPESVLILGGGDGLAVREILKHSSVKNIDLVDLDPTITDLAKNHSLLKKLNQNSLLSPKVKIINQDAFKYVENISKLYSVVIIDLPDPNEISLGKLYSREFYKFIDKILAQDGIVITQSTSPYFARTAFWCVNHTLQSAYANVLPLTIQVPSFGQWGFQVAAKYNFQPKDWKSRLKKKIQQLKKEKGLRFLNANMLEGIFIFDPDMDEVETEVNTLSTQTIVQYYEQGWKTFTD